MFIHSITFLLDQMDHKSNPKKYNMKRKKKWLSMTSIEIILRMSTSTLNFLINIVFQFYFIIRDSQNSKKIIKQLY